jgi:hypothetical protein
MVPWTQRTRNRNLHLKTKNPRFYLHTPATVFGMEDGAWACFICLFVNSHQLMFWLIFMGNRGHEMRLVSATICASYPFFLYRSMVLSDEGLSDEGFEYTKILHVLPSHMCLLLIFFQYFSSVHIRIVYNNLRSNFASIQSLWNVSAVVIYATKLKLQWDVNKWLQGLQEACQREMKVKVTHHDSR